MPKVYLLRNRKKRLEEGHPWVYASEVDRIEGEVNAGDVAEVFNHQGHFLAKGHVNPNSQMIVRILSYKPDEVIDTEFFEKRLREAWEHRLRWLEDTNACRLVYGEADFLPGLIVDKYSDTLVVQILSYGMEKSRGQVVDALVKLFSPKCVYERSDVGVRELEGLEQKTGLLYGSLSEEVEIVENGLRLVVDVVGGQKTGYFFDQRENRAAIGPLMTGWGREHGIHVQKVAADDNRQPIVDEKGRVAVVTESVDTMANAVEVPVDRRGKWVKNPFWDGAEVLECFSHTGSFTLNACKNGAKKVTCLDISEHAIDTAKRNVELNGYLHRVEFVVANAFDYLRDQGKEGRSWDVVILDPPAFAKSRQAVKGAYRGYKDINLNGLKLVREGGYLVTASCSYHMKPDLFKQAIHEAATDAKKVLRLIHWSGAGKDHPEIFGAEEGHYLKFAIFEVRSRG